MAYEEFKKRKIIIEEKRRLEVEIKNKELQDARKKQQTKKKSESDFRDKWWSFSNNTIIPLLNTSIIELKKVLNPDERIALLDAHDLPRFYKNSPLYIDGFIIKSTDGSNILIAFEADIETQKIFIVTRVVNGVNQDFTPYVRFTKRNEIIFEEINTSLIQELLIESYNFVHQEF